MTPLKAALSCSFFDPKLGQILEIIFKIKFPDNRFAGRPDYSRREKYRALPKERKTNVNKSTIFEV